MGGDGGGGGGGGGGRGSDDGGGVEVETVVKMRGWAMRLVISRANINHSSSVCDPRRLYCPHCQITISDFSFLFLPPFSSTSTRCGVWGSSKRGPLVWFHVVTSKSLRRDERGLWECRGFFCLFFFLSLSVDPQNDPRGNSDK